MWKVVTGIAVIAVIAVAAFFIFRHDSDESVEQSGVPANAQPSSAASQSASPDDTTQPRFTNYENEANRPKRTTKSTTGTVVVFPDGRRSPPR